LTFAFGIPLLAATGYGVDRRRGKVNVVDQGIKRLQAKSKPLNAIQPILEFIALKKVVLLDVCALVFAETWTGRAFRIAANKL
jgi:hypothetical protein